MGLGFYNHYLLLFHSFDVETITVPTFCKKEDQTLRRLREESMVIFIHRDRFGTQIHILEHLEKKNEEEIQNSHLFGGLFLEVKLITLGKNVHIALRLLSLQITVNCI